MFVDPVRRLIVRHVKVFPSNNTSGPEQFRTGTDTPLMQTRQLQTSSRKPEWRSLSLICLTMFTGARCALQSDASCMVQSNDQKHLIRLSQAEERSVWFPGVERLGRIANDDGTIRNEIWIQSKVNTLGMKFARITPGTFVMGPARHRGSQEAHPVNITKT